MKRLLLPLLLLISLFSFSQRENNRLSYYGLSAKGLAAAIAAVDHIEIDRSFTLDSAITIPIGKMITVYVGSVIDADSTLTIEGQLFAFHSRIFSDESSIKFEQYTAPTLIRPEWWGAKTMPNMRDTTITASNIDNAPFFESAISSINNPHYFNGQHTITTLQLSGIYGVGRKISVRERMVNIVGTHGYYPGTGFKFIGTLTGDSAQQFILEYSGADFSRLENVCFKGKRTTDTTLRMRGAVHFLTRPDETPQRKISLLNVSIGDNYGFWNDLTAGYEFKGGITVSDQGPDFNNDFFNLNNIAIANCYYAILNYNDQAMNWIINNFAVNYSETMIYMPKGGRFTGETWYPGTDVYGYMIMGGDDLSRTLSFHIKNWDIEDSKGDGLVWGNGKLVASFANGQVSNNGVDNDLDGFRIVGGDAMQHNPQITFENIRFVTQGRAYFDCSSNTNASSRGSIHFINCVAPEGVEFKFNTGAKTRQVYHININGRVITDADDIYMNMTYELTNSNPNISGGFVLLSDLIDEGTTSNQATTIVEGNRSYDVVSLIQHPRSLWRASLANDTMLYINALQPNRLYESVVITLLSPGIMSAGDYIKVGIAGDAEKFGRITSPSANSQNSKTVVAPFVVSTETDVILTVFDSGDSPKNLVAGVDMMFSVVYREHGKLAEQMSPDVWGFLPVYADP